MSMNSAFNWSVEKVLSNPKQRTRMFIVDVKHDRFLGGGLTPRTSACNPIVSGASGSNIQAAFDHEMRSYAGCITPSVPTNSITLSVSYQNSGMTITT